MSTDQDVDAAERFLSPGKLRPDSSQKPRSHRDVAEQIEAGFSQMVEASPSAGRQMGQGENRRITRARRAPRRPLNGTPTLAELE